MRDTTHYEWDYETVDENGDIIDHNFAAKLSEFYESDKTNQLVLVRNVGNVEDGVKDRSWAYVKDGKLPKEFDGGSKVPERFQKELDQYLK